MLASGQTSHRTQHDKKEGPFSTLLNFLVYFMTECLSSTLGLLYWGWRCVGSAAFTLSRALTSPRYADVSICLFRKRQNLRYVRGLGIAQLSGTVLLGRL